MDEPEYSLGLWGELKRSLIFTWRWFRVAAGIGLGLSLFYFLLVLAFGTMNRQHLYTWPGDQMSRSHTIGDALFYYAGHHDGKFPEGKSSTEVFQKLVDFGYMSPIDGRIVHDPGLFYVPMVGKTAPITGQPLRPENICWDVTSPMEANASDFLPLVFLTGYKITYTPGGTAVPLVKPYPPYTRRPGHWFDSGAADPADHPGIAVFYKGGQAGFRHLYFTETVTGPDTINPENSIPNFIQTDFDPKDITYHQLSPAGPVP